MFYSSADEDRDELVRLGHLHWRGFGMIDQPAPDTRRRLDSIRSALGDDRGRRVAFLSHCLLNENTRYLGGAFRPGAVTEVVEPFLRDGTGICQMSCPEQGVWGGVLKRHLLRFYCRPALRPVARAALPMFVAYTKLRYRFLARRVAREISDYVASGFEIVGVVGVGASPSCGVVTTLDMAQMLDMTVGCHLARIDRRVMNREVAAHARRGRGLFLAALVGELARRGMQIPVLEHDLRSEWPDSQLTAGAHRVGATGPRRSARP